jgi:ferredoxin
MMAELTERLRAEAGKLLSDGRVAMVIGYRQGPTPTEVVPAFITSPEGAQALVLNSLCVHNLATYLKSGTDGNVAVVAKPCDTRALVSLLQERQLKREQLVVVTVPCVGVVDVRKFRAALGEDHALVQSLSQEGQDLLLALQGGGVRRIPLADVLARKCVECAFQEPTLVDVRLDEGRAWASPPPSDRAEATAERIAAMPREERLRFWQEAFSRCIRCYACRSVCPVCFCNKCFADETMPQWVARSFGRAESELFHLVRFIHVAGRCTGCGECERVCPMKIPLTTVTDKMNQEVRELFGYEPGLTTEETPPLARFALEDLDIFGKG